MAFSVLKLCTNTNVAALLQSLKRRGIKVSKAHRLRAAGAYEGDAGISRQNFTDHLRS